MFWLMFRTIIYLGVFIAIWQIGQIYVASELQKGLHETSDHAIFVDQKILEDTSKTEMQNGSLTYPFSTIAAGLDAAKTQDISTLIIAEGNYEETLKLPENIILYGDGLVTINQDSNDTAHVITTNNSNKLINLHISGGNHAVVIPHNTSVTFLNTTLANANDFGVKMEKKERPKPPVGTTEPITYEVFDIPNDEIMNMPLVRFSNVTVTKNGNQGMYLFDGRVEIVNSHIVENGEEGIDLHPHMHATITNTDASRNGESGLETEVYDNTVIIENSKFTDNIKNGIALITSHGIGDISIINNEIINNQKFGLRCAIHKTKPKKPRPFFSSIITETDNQIEDNVKANISTECLTF